MMRCGSVGRLRSVKAEKQSLRLTMNSIYTAFSTRCRRLLSILGAFLLVELSAPALPITYSFDDTEFYDPTVGAGVGTFTIDIPAVWTNPQLNPPVLVHASQFSGGPGPSIGTWTDVVFGANDISAGLAFYDGVTGISYSLSVHGTKVWSTPQEAWSDLLAYWSPGVKIAPLRADSDQDGVPDDVDRCSNTPTGAIVDAHGCSIDQLIPCTGPSTGGSWKNHGRYVSSVAHIVARFVKDGLIPEDQGEEIVAAAARSDCGKR